MPRAQRCDSRVNRLFGLAAMSLPPVAVFAAAVAPRIRTCGTTREELTLDWPGDHLVQNPSFVWTNAVTIDRPAAQVWPWVTQLGQGRGGLYSYDWLENALLADVHSVHEIQPRLQGALQVGDRVIRMTRYAPHNPVALYEPGRALVLGGIKDSKERLQAGCPTSTWAFIVDPISEQRCRLVIRSRASALDARLQGPIQFVMQHRMMLGIKQRAEGSQHSRAADVLVPVSWFAATAVAAFHAARALRSGDFVPPRDTALASLAAVAAELLLFWDLPTPVRHLLVVSLAGSTALPATSSRWPR